jgi:integrase/recombinase XerD
MFLSKAIDGYILEGLAGNYSPQTMRLYKINLNIFLQYQGDCDLEAIKPERLTEYMFYLRNEYKPNRISKDISPYSPSALDNHWKALRSFFRWCSEVLELQRPDLHLPRQKFQLPEVIPFTEADVKAIIHACEYTKQSTTNNHRKPFRMRRPTASRDKALVLLLLDTGLRVSEVTRLQIKDINLSNGEVHVMPHGSGQKTKPRTVYLGMVARRSIWLYLNKLNSPSENEPLFDLSTGNIRLLLYRMGERASIKDVYPHRFRHTFAVQYLRNGGDVFTLQRILGHSTLDMVRKYLTLADADSAEAHRKASPADRWRL